MNDRLATVNLNRALITAVYLNPTEKDEFYKNLNDVIKTLLFQKRKFTRMDHKDHGTGIRSSFERSTKGAVYKKEEVREEVKKKESRKSEAQQQRGASAGKRGAVLKKVGPSVAKEFQQTESADEEDDYRKPTKTTKRPRLDK